MSDYFDAMKALKEMKCPMCYGHGGRIVHSGKPYRELQSCQDCNGTGFRGFRTESKAPPEGGDACKGRDDAL